MLGVSEQLFAPRRANFESHRLGLFSGPEKSRRNSWSSFFRSRTRASILGAVFGPRLQASNPRHQNTGAGRRKVSATKMIFHSKIGPKTRPATWALVFVPFLSAVQKSSPYCGPLLGAHKVDRRCRNMDSDLRILGVPEQLFAPRAGQF